MNVLKTKKKKFLCKPTMEPKPLGGPNLKKDWGPKKQTSRTFKVPQRQGAS